MESQHNDGSDRREKDDGKDGNGRDREKRSWLKANVGETERMISGAGGGALAAYGIVRGITNRSWGGAALALLGGVLAYRGLTGHCPVYERLGISTADEPENRTDQLKFGEGMVKEDLRRFKQMMETSEIPTTKGQASGGAKSERNQEEKTTGRFAGGTRDTVDEASWESFPASDPPAW